jgi:hypothetical protein
VYNISLYLDASTSRDLCGYDEVSTGVGSDEVFSTAKRMFLEDGAKNIVLRANVTKDGSLLYNEDGTPVQVLIPLVGVIK